VRAADPAEPKTHRFGAPACLIVYLARRAGGVHVPRGAITCPLLLTATALRPVLTDQADRCVAQIGNRGGRGVPLAGPPHSHPPRRGEG